MAINELIDNMEKALKEAHRVIAVTPNACIKQVLRGAYGSSPSAVPSNFSPSLSSVSVPGTYIAADTDAAFNIHAPASTYTGTNAFPVVCSCAAVRTYSPVTVSESAFSTVLVSVPSSASPFASVSKTVGTHTTTSAYAVMSTHSVPSTSAVPYVEPSAFADLRAMPLIGNTSVNVSTADVSTATSVTASTTATLSIGAAKAPKTLHLRTSRRINSMGITDITSSTGRSFPEYISLDPSEFRKLKYKTKKNTIVAPTRSPCKPQNLTKKMDATIGFLVAQPLWLSGSVTIHLKLILHLRPPLPHLEGDRPPIVSHFSSVIRLVVGVCGF